MRKKTVSTNTPEVYTKDGLHRLLKSARDKGASEIHFKVPKEPMLRINGELVSTHLPAVRPQTSHQVAHNICSLAGVEIPLASITETEFAFGMVNIGRFRVHLYRQRGSIGIIIRRSALEVPVLSSFGLERDSILPTGVAPTASASAL